MAVSVPAKTIAGDADLRKVIAERPVPEVVPDEHPRQVAANLLQAGGQLLAADTELQKNQT